MKFQAKNIMFVLQQKKNINTSLNQETSLLENSLNQETSFLESNKKEHE